MLGSQTWGEALWGCSVVELTVRAGDTLVSNLIDARMEEGYL